MQHKFYDCFNFSFQYVTDSSINSDMGLNIKEHNRIYQIVQMNIGTYITDRLISFKSHMSLLVFSGMWQKSISIIIVRCSISIEILFVENASFIFF